MGQSQAMRLAVPPLFGDELEQIRQELDLLVRWRRLYGFTVDDQERYWALTERELCLLRRLYLAQATLTN